MPNPKEIMEMNQTTLREMAHMISVIKRLKHSVTVVMEAMEQRWRDYPMSREVDELLERMGEEVK